MAKNIFKSTDVNLQSRRVLIDYPTTDNPVNTKDETSDDQVFEGPSVQELQLEAEKFRQSFEKEKEVLSNNAIKEAEKIKKDIIDSVNKDVEQNKLKAEKTLQDAEEQARRLIQEAKEKAEQLELSSKENITQIENQAMEKGLEEGRDNGYQEGLNEVNRLIERLNSVISKTINKRIEIIDQCEEQVISLVMLISKKVVKVVSESQKEVVIHNTIEALKKIKKRGDIILRVNTKDINLTSSHTADFIEKVENVDNVTILEDSTVDQGGCIVETDFGQIDARIASQLNKIEEKILDLSPGLKS